MSLLGVLCGQRELVQALFPGVLLPGEIFDGRGPAEYLLRVAAGEERLLGAGHDHPHHVVHLVVQALDGKPLFRIVAPPSGLAKDGASTVYRRVPVIAGRHRISARLADGPEHFVRWAVHRGLSDYDLLTTSADAVGGEFIIMQPLASGTDRGNGRQA